MDFFFFWFLFSIAVGIFGSSKGRSGFGWFLFSMLLSPLLGLIFCAVCDDLKHPKESAPTEKTHTKCTACREFVLRDAIKCKHCGTTLVPQNINEPKYVASSAAYGTGVYLGKNWGVVISSVVGVIVLFLLAIFLLAHSIR